MRRTIYSVLIALMLASGVYGQALWNGIQPQQNASNPLQLRVSDGDLTSILGTYRFSATTVALTPSATNYVFLDISVTPPVLTVNTTGFPATKYYPIAIVVTGVKSIISMTDSRPAFNSTSFGGANPAGSNGDLQIKSGTVLGAGHINDNGTNLTVTESVLPSTSANIGLKHATADAVQYVTTGGNDSNDGLSWGTSKLTITGALCALPSGNCSSSPQQAGKGTVYFVDGVTANANSSAGIWIAGTTDSQYSSLPAGWMQSPSNGGFNLICSNFGHGVAHGNRPSCSVTGSSAANAPLVWFSGIGGIYVYGMGPQCCSGRFGNVGVDSSGSVSSGGAQLISTTLENVFSQSPGFGTAGHGPQLTVGNGFWLHIHDGLFSGNMAESLSVSSVSRSSNVDTFTMSGTCPFVTGDNISVYGVTDNTFNGTFTAASGCSGGSTFTIAQNGPNASSSGGVAASDRAFSVVLYGSQIELARMHEENGGGIKFYPQSDGNVQLNDTYMEGGGTTSLPVFWASTLLGPGGQADLGGIFQADTPTLPSIINEGTTLFVHTAESNNTQMLGPANMISAADAGNRKTGLIASGQSGWSGNYFEAQMDTARRTGSSTAVRFPNLAFQSTGSWVNSGNNISGSGYTTTTGQKDPFGGTGAIEIDSSGGTVSVAVYSSGSALSIGDTYMGGVWIRAVNGSFPSANSPMSLSLNAFGLGGGDYCTNGQQSVHSTTPYIGDGNWFWVSVACTVWANPANPGLVLTVGVDATHSIQVFRPWFIKVPSGTLSATELADLQNSNTGGYSTDAVAGDVSFYPSQKLCTPSSSPTNDFCGYIVHNNTANRTYTFPDSSGTVCLSGVNCATSPAGSTNDTQYNAGGGSFGAAANGKTGQVLTSTNAAPPSYQSPGIADGNGGAAVTSTPYTIQCDSGTAIVDRAHILRFQSGAAAVTVPLSSASGCTGNYVVSVVDDGAGTLTFSASGADTFSVFSGVTNTDGATSFTITNGQHATLNQGASGIWEVRITGLASNGVGGTTNPASPLEATIYISPNCPAGNTGSCYQTPADTQEADDCAWTSGQPDVTCNTAHFVASDVGKSAGGGRTCAAFQSQALLGANVISASSLLTIASYISATHITLSGNAANTQTVQTGFPWGGCFVWGHPDDTAFASAQTAGQNATQCPKIEIVAGYYMVTQPFLYQQPPSCVHTPAGIFNSYPNPNGVNEGNIFYAAGEIVEGRGPNNTMIYMMQNFPGAGNCSKGPGAPATALACFVIPVMATWRDFQLTGGWQGNPSGFASNTVLVYAAGANYLENINCTNMGAFSTNISYGFQLDWQVQVQQFNSSGCGNIGMSTVSGHGAQTLQRIAIENSIIADFDVENGTVHCYDCKFENSQATVTSFAPYDIINHQGQLFCEQCVVTSGGVSGPANAATGYINNTVAGTATFRDSIFVFNGTGNAGNSSITCQISGGTVILSNTSLTSNASGTDYSDVSGCTLFDLGHNTYTPRFSISGGVIGEANSASTTAVTAAKVVLSAGWGSTAAVTALKGGDFPNQFTITNSGTGQLASPTITYTFPTALAVAPFSCTATQVGGNNATGTFTSSSLSTTGVTFTYSLTPTASDTEIIQVTCVTP